MQTQSSRWSQERRAYYRLLRHLLSEEVRSAYADERPAALPDRLGTLLESLEQRARQERR